MVVSSTASSPPPLANLQGPPEFESHPHQIEYRHSVEFGQGKPLCLDGASTSFVDRVASCCHEVNGLYHLDRRARISPLL
jgi:hypothetical protein